MMLRYLILLLFVNNFMYGQMENIKSSLEVFDLETNTRTVIYEENEHFEAPNWSRDGEYLIFNSHGKLFQLFIETKKKIPIHTDFADKINNDHGISSDGTLLVISHSDQPKVNHEEADYMTSRIYTLPITGGTPEAVTSKTPSFWHGWSPDDRTLTYTALRDGNFDIYMIDVKGGDETRLTFNEGLDDGPDYSADGKHIYYNSMQSGKMEIWRMKTDGSEKEQFTDDNYSNWFPHPSPDGKYVVFISYIKDQGDRHPAMKDVALRLYNLQDNSIKTLCLMTGGQGTINVPSWSPDGKKFAFVSYEFINQE